MFPAFFVVVVIHQLEHALRHDCMAEVSGAPAAPPTLALTIGEHVAVNFHAGVAARSEQRHAPFVFTGVRAFTAASGFRDGVGPTREDHDTDTDHRDKDSQLLMTPPRDPTVSVAAAAARTLALAASISSPTHHGATHAAYPHLPDEALDGHAAGEGEAAAPPGLRLPPVPPVPVFFPHTHPVRTHTRALGNACMPLSPPVFIFTR